MVAVPPDTSPQDAVASWGKMQNLKPDTELHLIETLEDCISELARARAQREGLRAERDKLKAEVDELRTLKYASGKHADEIARREEDIKKLRETINAKDDALMAASQATLVSRGQETIKALQSSDLAQRKHLDIQADQIQWLLSQLKQVGWTGDINDAPLPQYLQREEPTVGQLFSGASAGAAVQGAAESTL